MDYSNKTVSPKIVSVFSGCGGLDLGFHMEGYQTIWTNDFAEWAVASLQLITIMVRIQHIRRLLCKK